MRPRCVFALAAGLACIALLAPDAAAMYHPTVGRFMQRDPVGYADGMSLYLYGAARPVSAFDPSGLRARPRPLDMDPALGQIVIPIPIVGDIVGDIAEILSNKAQAALTRRLTDPQEPRLPPLRTGGSFASYEYCCLCVDAAIRQRNYAERRAQAYMDKVRDPNVRTASDLEKAVHGKGGAMGPGKDTGATGPFDSKVYPQTGPCGELLTQGAAEHERSHWDDRNDLLAASESGAGDILSQYPGPLGGGDKYFHALSEAGACDAEMEFLDEFLRACRDLGVGD